MREEGLGPRCFCVCLAVNKDDKDDEDDDEDEDAANGGQGSECANREWAWREKGEHCIENSGDRVGGRCVQLLRNAQGIVCCRDKDAIEMDKLGACACVTMLSSILQRSQPLAMGNRSWHTCSEPMWKAPRGRR